MAENKERALKPKAFTPTFKIENNIIDDFLAEDESLFELFNEESITETFYQQTLSILY